VFGSGGERGTVSLRIKNNGFKRDKQGRGGREREKATKKKKSLVPTRGVFQGKKKYCKKRKAEGRIPGKGKAPFAPRGSKSKVGRRGRPTRLSQLKEEWNRKEKKRPFQQKKRRELPLAKFVRRWGRTSIRAQKG